MVVARKKASALSVAIVSAMGVGFGGAGSWDWLVGSDLNLFWLVFWLGVS